MVCGRFRISFISPAVIGVILLGLAGCGEAADNPTASPTPSSSATLPAPSLSPGAGASATWRALAQLDEAEITLPSHSRSKDATLNELTVLSDWKKSASRGNKPPHYTHALPLSIPPKRYKQAPLDLVLLQGGQALDYNANLDRESNRVGWMAKGEALLLSSKLDPNTPEGKVTLDHSAFSAHQNRLAYSDANLSKAEFVDLEVTLGRETRRTLLLPAPGRAQWTVKIPEGGTLTFGTGIRDRPLRSEAAGDGVTFSVEIDGQSIWDRKASPEKDFEDHTISLDDYAGKTVELALVTAPRKTTTSDYAVWSSPRIVGNSSSDVRRVVVIGIDTLRPDHLGVHGYPRDTSPELDEWAKDAFVFDSAWAPAPRTKPSFRSAFTGRYPLAAVNTPSLGQVLYDEGFATGGISANVHLVPRLGFNRGFEYWHYENGARGDDQVDRALEWLKAHEKEDSFLFLHIMDPHIFYNAPRPYKNKFVEESGNPGLPEKFNRWEIYKRMKRGDLDAKSKAYIEAKYDGEVAYTSNQVRRFLDAVDALPGRTLTVIHSDHGEEFFEHDGFEHNHTLYDEVTRVVFWVKGPDDWPGGPHHQPDQVNLIDLVPTIYDALDIPKERLPALDGESLRPLMDDTQADRREATRASLTERALHLGYLMYDTERWAAVDDNKKYILHTVSGEEEFYDLEKDPGELKNRAPAMGEDLAPWRVKLAAATGWPVGDGWRIRQRSSIEPYTVTFDKPIAAATVINPEAGVKRRANLEWGEVASKLASEVATITLSEDRTQISVVPGERPAGTIAVRFATPPPSAATFALGDTEDVVPANGGKAKLGKRRLTIERGTVILQQDSMAKQLQTKESDDASLEALRALGYIE